LFEVDADSLVEELLVGCLKFQLVCFLSLGETLLGSRGVQTDPTGLRQLRQKVARTPLD